VAEIVFDVKESLGARTRVLFKLMDAFSAAVDELTSQKSSYVVSLEGCRGVA
jgi:hypothetical protein